MPDPDDVNPEGGEDSEGDEPPEDLVAVVERLVGYLRVFLPSADLHGLDPGPVHAVLASADAWLQDTGPSGSGIATITITMSEELHEELRRRAHRNGTVVVEQIRRDVALIKLLRSVLKKLLKG